LELLIHFLNFEFIFIVKIIFIVKVIFIVKIISIIKVIFIVKIIFIDKIIFIAKAIFIVRQFKFIIIQSLFEFKLLVIFVVEPLMVQITIFTSKVDRFIL
jgi:hypothetical protein